MSLPLMPGSEPVQAPQPTEYNASFDAALTGCSCEACQRERARRQERAGAVPPPQVFDWGNAPAIDAALPRDLNAGRIRGRYDPSQGLVDVFRDAPRWLDPTTGHLFDENGLQMNTLYRYAADDVWQTVSGSRFIPDVTGPNAHRIRGRYDFSHSADSQSSLQGQVRWREPGTLEVYDEDNRNQWTYSLELPSGILEDTAGCRWVPTEV